MAAGCRAGTTGWLTASACQDVDGSSSWAAIADGGLLAGIRRRFSGAGISTSATPAVVASEDNVQLMRSVEVEVMPDVAVPLMVARVYATDVLVLVQSATTAPSERAGSAAAAAVRARPRPMTRNL